MLCSVSLTFYEFQALRAGGKAVDLRGPSVYPGGPKFEIKHKNRCLQKLKLVDWGAKHVDWGGGPLPPPLTPALQAHQNFTETY